MLFSKLITYSLDDISYQNTCAGILLLLCLILYIYAFDDVKKAIKRREMLEFIQSRRIFFSYLFIDSELLLVLNQINQHESISKKIINMT